MNCDLCNGAGQPLTQYPQVHICQSCGFLFVPERRSPEEIAKSWTEIYRSGAYSPDWPGVRARLFYVAEWLDQTIGLDGKSVLDIGAGNGFFLEEIKRRGAHPVGLEPDRANYHTIRDRNIACFNSHARDGFDIGSYDLVTINWTLENCGDCLEMLRFARRHAPTVSVATGSRILVPFKKPLSTYFGPGPADLHCFRWSRRSLARVLEQSGFGVSETNDYHGRDELIMLASTGQVSSHAADDPRQVAGYFAEWAAIWP